MQALVYTYKYLFVLKVSVSEYQGQNILNQEMHQLRYKFQSHVFNKYTKKKKQLVHIILIRGNWYTTLL